jgi:hypothetical protein
MAFSFPDKENSGVVNNPEASTIAGDRGYLGGVGRDDGCWIERRRAISSSRFVNDWATTFAVTIGRQTGRNSRHQQSN